MTNLIKESKSAIGTVKDLLEIINIKLRTDYKSNHFYSWSAGTTKTPATAQRVMREIVLHEEFTRAKALKLIEKLEPPARKGGD